jgi:hypothetical protein
LAFLLVSVVPIFVDAATNDPYNDQYRGWGIGLFSGFHLLYINPVVDLLGFAALYAQARVVTSRTPGSGLGALSLVGLGAQAFVFALLAPAWLWRLVFPWEEFYSPAAMWFLAVGFVPFDYAVFAVTQFVLLLIVVRRRRGRPCHGGNFLGSSAGETEPLLGS